MATQDPTGAVGTARSTDAISFLVLPEHAPAVADVLRSTISLEANSLDGCHDTPPAEITQKLRRMEIARAALEDLGWDSPEAAASVTMPREDAEDVAKQLIEYAIDLAIDKPADAPPYLMAGATLKRDLSHLAQQTDTRIKQHRKARGMKRAELAELLGVLEKSVRGWETNMEFIPHDALNQMAELFGVHPLFLLGYSDRV